MGAESGVKTCERGQPGFSLRGFDHKEHKDHKARNLDSEISRKERKGRKKHSEGILMRAAIHRAIGRKIKIIYHEDMKDTKR